MFSAHRAPLLASLAVIIACDAPPAPEVQTSARAVAPVMTQILPAASLARYKAALPSVVYKRLDALLQSEATLWWDKETMVPSYQDSVGDGSYTPIGARANSQGRAVIVPQGKRLFTPDGETWSFPFSETAGTDRSTNTFVVNFLSLPDDGTAFWPIVYETVDDNSAVGGLGLHQWTWMFPKGTLIGEVIYLVDPQGDLVPAEIRTRERFLDGWATNAYRPFPRAVDLATAIETARPDWASQPNLAAFVQHLRNPATLEAGSLSSPDFNGIFSASGYLDELPPVGDATLVRELLTTTPFVSAYGEAWKENGTQRTFAATTQEAFSFVPNNYDAGLLEVRESTCTQCHQDAGRAINDFEPAAVLYGDIWGSDQIFSFHPWDESQYSNFNYENRQVRPALAQASLVVRYNSTTHPASMYKGLPRP